MKQNRTTFRMEDQLMARKRLAQELLNAYGDHACGRALQPRNEGGRKLFRRKSCEGTFSFEILSFIRFLATTVIIWIIIWSAARRKRIPSNGPVTEGSWSGTFRNVF